MTPWGFRGHKADLYEGGHRVPFIVRWPKGIKAGQKTDAMACHTDSIQHWKQSPAKAERTLEARMATTSFQFSTESALRVAQPSSATRSAVTLPSVRVTGNSVSQQAAAAGVRLGKGMHRSKGSLQCNFSIWPRIKLKRSIWSRSIQNAFRNSSRSCKKKFTTVAAHLVKRSPTIARSHSFPKESQSSKPKGQPR